MRLLQRLGQEPRSGQDVDASIAEHLLILLNARRGDAPTAPDFGLQDFSDLVHNFPEAIRIIQQSIRATVLAYEPRLQSVSVRHLPSQDPLSLRFEIIGRLAEDRRSLVRLSTQLNSGGQFELE